ncbi:hypothetical protein R1sor_000455 [Riccia sorocarpa]|uniref:Uncharacterized protein n=1 Tax=Riccia sorocarpa TaxID=122646 RepID=A0ABD3GTZ6_9MARC
METIIPGERERKEGQTGLRTAWSSGRSKLILGGDTKPDAAESLHHQTGGPKPKLQASKDPKQFVSQYPFAALNEDDDTCSEDAEEEDLPQAVKTPEEQNTQQESPAMVATSQRQISTAEPQDDQTFRQMEVSKEKRKREGRNSNGAKPEQDNTEEVEVDDGANLAAPNPPATQNPTVVKNSGKPKSGKTGSSKPSSQQVHL